MIEEVVKLVFYHDWPPYPPQHYRSHPHMQQPPHFHKGFQDYGHPQSGYMNKASFLNQLQKEDGSFDFEKILNHGGQIVEIVNQARPLVKQMGPLIDLFKKN